MKNLKWTFLSSVLLIFIPTIQPILSVKINDSLIVGRRVELLGKKVDQYLGVPFAEPPVGPLRFKKPVPVQEYPPVFDAVHSPPACAQYTDKPWPWYPNGTKSEDCLYLNIWVPADASKRNKKAVMYWMFGGGHRYGSNDIEVYNGLPLAALGDIIVVTTNYRVGYFGWLTSNTPDAPGNLGLWDVLEGLRWVNKYIEEFGGDVSRITIAGVAAGSISTGLLTISPLAKDLFSRQILESATPAYRRADNNTQNLAFSQQVAEYVGCATDDMTIETHPTEVVQCLRTVPVDALSKANYDLNPSFLTPQFGDEILPDNPRLSVLNGDFKCKDLLIGNNKDEGSFMIAAQMYPDYFGFWGEKNTHVNRTMGRDIIRKISALFPDPEAIVDHYIPPEMTEDTNFQIRTRVYTAVGDTVLYCPTAYYAEKCAEKEGNVFFYLYAHRSSRSPWAPWIGVTHFDEVPFVFGAPIYEHEYDQPEIGLSKQIIEIWSSFVKTGSPSIPWPKYDQDRNYKFIGPYYVTGVDGANGVHSEHCDFLKPFFAE